MQEYISRLVRITLSLRSDYSYTGRGGVLALSPTQEMVVGARGVEAEDS